MKSGTEIAEVMRLDLADDRASQDRHQAAMRSIIAAATPTQRELNRIYSMALETPHCRLTRWELFRGNMAYRFLKLRRWFADA